MLSPTHNVLIKNDLIIDSWYGNPGPPDTDASRWGYPRWICVDKKFAKFKYTTWIDTELSTPKDIQIACDYYFEIKDKNQIHFFAAR